jgi:hypothetical protein
VPLAFRRQCNDAGLSPADTAKLVDLLRRRQSGRRLVVGSTFYRGFTLDALVGDNRDSWLSLKTGRPRGEQARSTIQTRTRAIWFLWSQVQKQVVDR